MNQYTIAISELSTDQVYAEKRRLELSEVKLRETNEQLDTDEYRHETFAIDAIEENNKVLESYVWKRRVIQSELDSRISTEQVSGIEL